MSASDKIQLAIANVAGIAAILTAVNIWFTNKQFRFHKKHWEFSYAPIFRISHSESFLKKEIQVVIENSNSVFYRIQSVEFSLNGVSVDSQAHGFIGYSTVKNGVISEKKYEGFRVILTPKDRKNMLDI